MFQGTLTDNLQFQGTLTDNLQFQGTLTDNLQFQGTLTENLQFHGQSVDTEKIPSLRSKKKYPLRDQRKNVKIDDKCICQEK